MKSPYTILDKDSQEIRLVSFGKAKDATFRGRLYHFPLFSCPKFVAISYTWGTAPPRRTIYLNGKKFRLRENIYQAMVSILRLRSRYQAGDLKGSELMSSNLPLQAAKLEYFWIDSICIDQSSSVERNHQVALMGQIFSKAALLISWLGSSNSKTHDIVREICSYRAHPVAIGFGQMKVSETLKGALDFFGSIDYWSRLWIVQEIVLAKEILVLWGDSFLPWYKVTNVGFARMGRRWSGISTLAHMQHDVNEFDENWVKVIHEKERYRLYQEEPEKFGWHHSKMTPRSLYALVLQFEYHHCLVPRDRVIGLLGLSYDDASELIDYDCSTEEYFEKVCQFVFNSARLRGESMKSSFRTALRRALRE